MATILDKKTGTVKQPGTVGKYGYGNVGIPKFFPDKKKTSTKKSGVTYKGLDPGGGAKPKPKSTKKTTKKTTSKPKVTWKATGSGSGSSGGSSSSKKTSTKKTTTKKTTTKKGTGTGVPWVPDVNAYNAAQNAVRAAYADKGLMNSSMFAGSMGVAANEDARRAYQEQEAVRQFNETLAARAYEIQRAGMLGEAQIRGEFKNLSTQMPNMPASWGSLQSGNYATGSQNYKQPGATAQTSSVAKTTAAPAAGAPITPAVDPYKPNTGDAKNQSWSGFTPAGGKTLGGKQLDASMAEAAARIALQKQQMAFQREQFEYQKAQNDPTSQDNIWKGITGIVDGVWGGIDEKTGQAKKIKFASVALAEIKSMYGIDIRKAAQDPKDPNFQRAQGVWMALMPVIGTQQVQNFNNPKIGKFVPDSQVKGETTAATPAAAGNVTRWDSFVNDRPGSLITWGKDRAPGMIDLRAMGHWAFGDPNKPYEPYVPKNEWKGF